MTLYLPEDRLAEMGIELPEPPEPAAAYAAWQTVGDLVFTAGQLPVVDGALQATGKLGGQLTRDEGIDLARTAAINILAIAQAAAGGELSKLRVVKLTVYVASTPDFTDQHLVANGASNLLGKVFDEPHARSAVAVPVLPLNSPVEVEAVLNLGQ